MTPWRAPARRAGRGKRAERCFSALPDLLAFERPLHEARRGVANRTNGSVDHTTLLVRVPNRPGQIQLYCV